MAGSAAEIHSETQGCEAPECTLREGEQGVLRWSLQRIQRPSKELQKNIYFIKKKKGLGKQQLNVWSGDSLSQLWHSLAPDDGSTLVHKYLCV